MKLKALHEDLRRLDRLGCGLEGLIMLRSTTTTLSPPSPLPLHEGGL